MKQPHNFRAWLAFVHDLCAAGLAWAAHVLGPFRPRFPRAVPRRHGAHARVDPAAAGRDLRRVRPLSRPVAIRERPRPAAHRACRRTGRAADSAGAHDAAAAGGRAAQRADLLPDRAHLPDGGQSLRLPNLEGAPAVQPARGPRRAGARDRRRRGRRAPDARVCAEPAMARRRADRRRPGETGTPAGRRERAGADLEPPDLGQEIRRAPGDRRAPLGRARRAPARRGDLRRRRHRGADGAVVRGPDQRSLGVDHDPDDRARRPAGPRSGGARQRGTRRVARQPRGHGHRRGRLDRRRAVPAHRPFPPGEARAVRPVRGCGLR